jgi:hypothetical protein
MTHQHHSLRIVPAQLGGYVVYGDSIQMGETTPAVFAGSLPDCMEFMRAYLNKDAARPPIERPA